MSDSKTTAAAFPAALNRKQLDEWLRKGQPVMVAELRTAKEETIRWRDKTSGRALEASVARINLETASEVVAVSVDLPEKPDGTRETVAEYLAARKLEKGKIAVAFLRGLELNRGAMSARGSLALLTD